MGSNHIVHRYQLKTTSNGRRLRNIEEFNISATTGKITLKFEALADGIKLNVKKSKILKSLVHISKGKFIGNPNEKDISRVALLSPACLSFIIMLKKFLHVSCIFI